MDTIAFLRTVLPQNGWLVGLALRDGLRRQSAFPSLEELIAWQLQHDAQGFDVYHACASFRDKRGAWNEHKQKFELRSHANALAVASLWFDIDTRESKENAKYVDRVEAWNAVEAFRQVARLPPALYVGSGGGLHVYWPLCDELQLAEWEVYARALKRAAHRYGLEADPARTSDGSTVLRTPGTHHWKTGRTVECGAPVEYYEIEQFEHLTNCDLVTPSSLLEQRHNTKELDSDESRSPRLRNSQPGRMQSPLARAAAAVYGNEPSDCRAIQRACAQVQQFAVDPGSASEPVWYAVCGLAVHAGAGGIRWLDDLPYRRQLQSDTIEWNERKRAQWQAQTSGPPTCAHFESVNPGGCKGCSHQGTITSPILLGRQASAPLGSAPGTDRAQNGHALNGETHPEAKSEIVLPDLPDPWRWSEQRQLILPAEKNDGRPNNTVVSDHAIYLDMVTRTETVGQHSYTFQQFHPNHGWSTITIPAGSMFSGHAMGDLADGGASIREPKLFTRYVHDALARWHRDNTMEDRYEQCGWKDDERAFLVGTTLYTADGVHPVTGTDELTARAQYLRPTSRGSVRGWTKVANQLFAGSTALLTIILASFASPLMRFHTRHEGGGILSAVNRESGTGKTTALEGAMSVWGDPLGLQLKWADTLAARGLVLANVSNLPIMFDELAAIAASQGPQGRELLYNLVMLFTGGTDRVRAQQHGKGLIHVQGSWQTILIASSNLSIVDQLQSYAKGIEAPGRRVLEFKTRFPDRFDYATGDRLKAELFENAGHAGAAFLKHLLQPEILDFTRKMLDQTVAEIWKSTKWNSEHRFWVRMISSIYVAGHLVRSLGLLNVDPDEVITWLISELRWQMTPGQEDEGTREARHDADALEVLASFCAKNQRGLISMRKAFAPGQGKADPLVKPLGSLTMRYEQEPNRLFIPAKEFRQFIIDDGHSFTDVTKTLEQGEILVNRKRMVTLAAGAHGYTGAPVACMEFNMGHPLVAQMPVLVDAVAPASVIKA